MLFFHLFLNFDTHFTNFATNFVLETYMCVLKETARKDYYERSKRFKKGSTVLFVHLNKLEIIII